jgi:phage/plasmid-like protein (TIGR03299 family)
MRLDREIRIGGAEGEDVLPLLCFRNGHDGGLAVTVSVVPFRLACLNGMLLPIPGAERTWKARHTANVEAKLADARRTLGIAWRYYDELEELGGLLIRERIGEGEFERFLARLVPLPEPRPDATDGGRAVRNAERVREAIRTAYRTAPDLDNVRGTRWGALQAVTSYVDHVQPTRRTAGRTQAEARFARATEPQPLKDRALELLPPEKRLSVHGSFTASLTGSAGWRSRVVVGQARSAIRCKLCARAIPPTQVCAPASVRNRVRRSPLRFSCEIRPSSPLRKR